jgi:hypothetical protein
MTPEDHSGGPVRCDQLGPFVDGELLPEEAAAFRKHLVVCARCQQEMHGLMQLSALAEQARVQRPVERPEIAPVVAALDRRARPRRAAWIGVVGAVAIAAAVVLALRGHSSGPDMPALLASLDARTVSGWPSAAGPAQYKEYRVMRGVSQVPIPPALAQAELRLQGSEDWRTLGTLALLRRDFPQADAYLARLPPTPDVLADRGLVRLEEQQYPEALEYLDRALRERPDFLPARFNRALALQALQLPYAAAAAMGPVSQSTAGGWADEARRDASAFEHAQKGMDEERARAKAQLEALTERQEAPDPALVNRQRSMVRAYFYMAAASAGTRAELERLRPVAVALDRELGSDVLAARIAAALRGWTFARPPLAARYREWILNANAKVPPPEELDRTMTEARRAGQKDILQQIYDGFRPYEVTAEREALDRASRDPWFQATFAARAARAEAEAGHPTEAERRIRQARELCQLDSMQIPCWYLAEALGDLYRGVGRFADAEREYRAVAATLRAARLYPFERKANLEAARVAVQADQVALARASYEDLSIREPGRCLTWIWSRELLASGYVARGDAESARKLLVTKTDCKGTLEAEPWRARLRLHLGQLTGDRSLLEEARAMASGTQGLNRTDPAETTAARVLEKIAALELGESGAERGLRDTIAAAESSPDVQVRSAAAEGRETLALRALAAADGSAAFGELARLLGTPVPSRCAVGLVAGVARAGWAATDASGKVVAGLSDAQGARPTLPGEVVDRLRACPSVAVLSTGRYQGRQGVLPDDLAWSYRLGTESGAAARPPGGTRLLVRDVLPPRDLQLPSLAIGATPASNRWTVVSGANATPSRVLTALGGADVVDFEVHGLIDPSVPDGAVLVLSEDADHRYALSATQLATQKLPRRPIVLLGACRAAAPSAFRAEPWSLPRSFVQAGARGVYASLSDLPDQDVGEFFRELTARLDGGAGLAQALRDERLAWLGQGKSWVRDVVLFD